MALNVGDVIGRIKVDFSQFNKGFDRAVGKMENFSDKMQSMAVKSAAAFAGLTIGIKKFADISSESEENLNVLNQSFGKLTPSIRTFASELADSAQRSALDMEKLVASAGAVTAPMLGNADAAAKMSTQMAQLSVDMGSFFNVADDEAFQALRAGIIGSSEPMLRFGVDVREGALATFALAQGIDKSTKAMSQGEKAALRMQLIMSQLGNVQGDAERTQESYANAVRGAQGAMKDFAKIIGDQMRPQLAQAALRMKEIFKTLQGLNPVILEAIGQGALFGATMLGAATALFTLGSTIGPVMKGLNALKIAFEVVGKTAVRSLTMIYKKFLPIVVIGVSVVSIIGAIGRAWDVVGDEIIAVAKQISKAITDAFKTSLEWLTKNFGPALKKISKLGITAFGFLTGMDADEVGAMLMEVEKSSAGLFSDAEENLKNAGKAIGGELMDVGKEFGKNLERGASMLGNVAKNLGLEGAIAAGFEKLEDIKGFEMFTGPQAAAVPAFQPAAVQLGDVTAGGDAKAAAEEKKRAEERIARGQAAFAATKQAEEFAQQQALSMFGGFGDLANNIMSGFEQGGPIGAAMAAFTTLASQTQAFAAIQEELVGPLFNELIAAFEPVIEALRPVVEVLVGAIKPIFKKLGGILKALSPVITALAFGFVDKLLAPLRPLLSALNAIAPLLPPLAELFSVIATLMNVGLMPAMLALDVGLKLLEPVLKAVGEFLYKVVAGIAGFWNGIVGTISNIFRSIAGIGVDIMGKKIRPFGFLNDFANSIDRAKINVDRMSDGMDAAANGTRAAGEAMCDGSASQSMCESIDSIGTATNDFSNSVGAMSEELTNVPTGFKTALERFNATSEGPGAMNVAPEAGLTSATGNLQIGTIRIANDDPRSIWEQIKNLRDFDGFAATGKVQLGGATQYLIPATGGPIP